MNLTALLIPPSLDAKQALRLRRFGVASFSYVLASHVLTVSTRPAGAAGSTPDLNQAKAQWLQRGLIAWEASADVGISYMKRLFGRFRIAAVPQWRVQPNKWAFRSRQKGAGPI